ncbi:LacI family DNA-binding transcriptional regulator [Euzebyella saccharophila]|uniref:Substrate-binding domain-containing protein n=1 Tax=Euzebyella saccharophila TaxID=679664 RepID=A0ABV8JQM8_9FLAO|nr:LacI family DNA-binding transcriptional regulator [Euzebyella saccharophila]
MSKKPTIKEIAKLANVSIGTVDRVIHNRGDVSKETTILIKKIMNELKYVPNTHARNLALNRNFKIAVLLPEHKNGEYWSEPMRAVQQANTDLKSFGVEIKIYLYNQKNKNSFIKESRRIFDEKNDAVLLAQVLIEESKIFMDTCKRKSIPYILIGSIKNDISALSTIGQNSYQGGRLAGELISFNQKKGTNFLIIHITKAQNPNLNVKERIMGFNSFFSDNNEFHYVIDSLIISEEDPDLIKKIQNKLIQTEKLGGVFVPNSKSHILVKALESKKLFRIVGYDLLDKNKQLLNKKKIDFLINQRPYEQAYEGIDYLYKYLGLQQLPPQIVSLPLDIVTKEKLMYY